MVTTAQKITPSTITPMPRRTPMIRRLPAILSNPLKMYTEEYFKSPMIQARFGGRSYAQVMTPDLAQQILQGDGEFVGRSIYTSRILKPALNEGLLTAEGPKWRRQRRAASPAFRAKALNALVPTFAGAGERGAERLIADHGKTVDVHPEMVHATFDVIADTLLADSGREHPQEQIAKDIADFIMTIGKISLHDVFPTLDTLFPRRLFIRGYSRGKAAVGRLRALSADLVERRLADDEPGKDLIGLLIAAQDPDTGDRLTPEELVDNVITFVGAGHETTALALTWALYILAQAPTIQDALAEEVMAVCGNNPITGDDVPHLELHERVIKETLRLFPPVPVIPRSVTAPVRIGTHDFVPGDHVSIGIYPMHRHKTLWDDPDTFDPDRFLSAREGSLHKYQFLPFGGGPRVCIGQRFAMIESIVMLATILRRVKVSTTSPLRVEPSLAITMRPKDGMYLHVTRRD